MQRIGPISACLIVLCGFSSVQAEDGGDYAKVKRLLSQRCGSCHGALSQKAELRLDTAAAIRKGGENGPAMVAGNTDESLLIQRVSKTDPAERMPPEGKPLTSEEISLLRSWIAAGAPSPTDEKTPVDPRKHWAFQKPIRPSVPVTVTGRNPIDAFVTESLAKRELSALPETDRTTLLRRVTLDLIGVPPTPDEIDRFLADDGPDAYERVVDRLLDDPRYGERWARHWMDVWRYSDWYGRRAVPDVMNSYPHIWRWRDWIVTSLNSDRGYDGMLRAMLAADELSPGDDSEVVATGFLVRNWFKWNYESWMKDNVEHTGKAFLGLTLNCCQCHDHKYDPITQREYFQFRAFFEPLELRQDRVAGLPDPGPFQKYVYAKSYGPIAAGLIRVFDEKLDAQTFMYSKGDARNRIEDEPPAVPLVPAALGTDGFDVTSVELTTDAWYPGLKSFIRTEELKKSRTAVTANTEAMEKVRQVAATARQTLADARALAVQPATAATLPSPDALLTAEVAAIDADAAPELAQAKLAAAESQLSALTARIAADDARYCGIGSPQELSRVASLAERQSRWLSSRAGVVTAEQALIAAERKAQTDEKTKAKLPDVQKQLDTARATSDKARAALAETNETYSPLSPVYPSKSTGRRAALARWITSPQNPLAARVAVNHVWMRHFGRGLVETPANFGWNGKAPTHPELLDWLAVEFMENGWQMKPLHRLIVTSAAYRRRSTSEGAAATQLAADPENSLYWRFHPHRMEAEVVRDSVLACSGTLNDAMGGQELDHATGLTAKRRSLYFASHGESQMQFVDLFDGPTPAECYQRTSSVVPQQALSLSNSELVVAQSRELAKSLWVACSASDDRHATFVKSAFRRVLARSPSEAELRASVDFVFEQTRLLESEAGSEATAGTAGPSAKPPVRPGDAAQHAREDFVHALFNHNDFVTIR